MFVTIFDEIVQILHHDYAGCIDKKGWDSPHDYRNKINKLQDQGGLNNHTFVELVEDYLLDFKDLHMSFRATNKAEEAMSYVGFTIRRYEDRLYIISSTKENRLKPGDCITALDGISISKLVETHKRRLMETQAERENWSSILTRYGTAQVKDQKGQTFTIDLRNYEKEPYEAEYFLKEIAPDTLLLTLTDFMNHHAISSLIDKNSNLLKRCDHLIVDVRINKGGNDLAYFELLSYLFEGDEINLADFTTDRMLTNCTKRNVELRVEFLKKIRHSIQDENTLNQLNALICVLEENKGKGFVELNSTAIEDSLLIKTKEGPKNVILLTDVYCGSSGDSFVEVCKHSSKVTVIGRPTMGLNDYSNLAVRNWHDEFELWYPTSKLSRVDSGDGMSGKGIEPDLYIPWSLDHIHEDIDLQKAVELIMERNRLFLKS
ncbi:S41 family peptidase [Alkalihalobacillus macyae]|uniref:S41 family peptidase n=1 Tax=Guptibacillus hwajinpoensis TaxID=208199 RepID=UPI00273C75B6|nr:S41 family peptidase [Alkalihalobacillus macyae]MDP4552843.1 S41 family peptidase [Alkalihalobacillus macyae]